MSFKLVLPLAWRKVTFQKVRSIVMALPIVVMVAIIVALSGWVGGFKNFIDKEVLEPVEQQSVLLSVENPQHSLSNDPYSLSPAFTSIPQPTVAKLKAIPGVKSVTPSSWMTYKATIDFDDIELSHTHFDATTLDSSLGQLYGAKDFTFHPGQPIPVIISARSLQEYVIDFDGQSSVMASTICYGDDRSACEGPVKQVDHRELLNQQLIGKTGTLSYNLLPEIPIAVYSSKGSQQTFTKTSAEQVASFKQKLAYLFSPYWDLERLQQPERFKFRVVGIEKSADLAASYMPPEAVAYINNRLHQRQAMARTSLTIPGDLLVKDIHASYLDQNDDVQMRSGISFVSMPAESLDRPYWSIPGLVTRTIDNGGKLSLEEVPNYTFTTDSLVDNHYIVRLTDASQRRSVQEAAADLKLIGAPSAIDESAAMMSTVLKMLAIAVGVVSLIAAIVVFILSWGFVADANYEIGLLRAMGATGWGVRGVMMMLILLIVLIGAVVGLGVGVGLMVAGAPYVANYANTSNFFAQVTLLYKLKIQPDQLYAPDFGLLSLSLLGVLILPILLTGAATFKRLKINPLEALKKDF
jgi:hypothetical protein